jgi:hypothetical protein
MKRLYHNGRWNLRGSRRPALFVTSNNEAATAGCSVSIDLSSLEYGRVGPAGARGRQRWAEALG